MCGEDDDRIELISFFFYSFIFFLNYKRVISRLLNALIFFFFFAPYT